MLKLETYIADWPDMDFPNLAAWMRHGRERWADRIAIRYRAGKKSEFALWTYARLFDQAEAFGRALMRSGLKSEDRVALWSENRPEWCAAWLGAVIAGCTIVPVDFSLTPDDVSGILAKAGAKALVLSPRKEEFLARFCEDCPSIAMHAVFDRDWETAIVLGEHPVSNGSLGAGVPGNRAELPPIESIPESHTASIIFTSGTTGIAKGVTLSHHGIIANINASIMSLPIYDRDVFMGVLPLHHTYPTTCAFLSPLTVGASLTICEKIVGKVIVDDTRDSRGTVVIAVPVLYDKLMAALRQGFRAKGRIVNAALCSLCAISRFFRVALHCRAAGEFLLAGVQSQAGLGSVRLLVAGGGALDPATADFFDDLGFNIVQGYGMSENGPLITTNTVKHKNNKAAGLPVKYTDVKIIDAGSDGVGEIAVKSPSLMKGYFENPAATVAAFDGDGYLKTGDLGYFDRRGFLFITGRQKNLIVTSGGKNIYPEEIESRFIGLSPIAQVLVLPRKGPKGEEIAAIFVPDLEYFRATYGDKSGSRDFIESILRDEVQKVNRVLVSYQKITSWGVRMSEFEQTATKKIKRFLYRDYDEALGD